MPAHEQRKQVLCRMYPDELLRLDALCVAFGSEGRPASRSTVINRLVEQAFDKMPDAERREATDAVRQHFAHYRPQPAVAAASEG